jgi:peptide deformylase
MKESNPDCRDIILIIIMILPIVGYGHPVLRKVGENISQEHPELKETIANMYDTMYNACGGLVAPQVGKAFRLFIIDTTPLVKMKI